MKFKDFNKHFPTKVSKELCDFVENVVMLGSRYIFTQRSGCRLQFGYCTHCQKRFHIEVKLKHKSSTGCPNCKSLCWVQAAGLGRKYMRDHAVLVWYEKSILDPNAITARVIHVKRDYSKDFENVQTQFSTTGMYLFVPGQEGIYFSGNGKTFIQKKTVFSEFDTHYQSGNCPRFHSVENMMTAIAGTPYQYSTWDKYLEYQNRNYVSDMTEFFDLASKYPCIEYLTKSGFGHLVKNKLHGNQTHGAIHWRGKTLLKVLRLGKQDFNHIIKRKIQEKFDSERLLFLQRYRRNGGKRDIEEVSAIYDLEKSALNADMRLALDFMTDDELWSYLFRQLKKNGSQVYNTITTVFSDYKDYLYECIILGIDLHEHRYLFPNCLRTAHQRTSEKVQIKSDKKNVALIMYRLQHDLADIWFNASGFIIRPAASQEEMFAEGKALNTCVGSYAPKYATGETNIFMIRSESDPDTPLYTCEIRPQSWTTIQVRGKSNQEAPKEVQILVKQFAEEMKQRFMKVESKKGKINKAVAV